MARGLKKALERDPSALDAERLAAATPADVDAWLDPPSSFSFPQLAERARIVQEVGRVLLSRFGGEAADLVGEARGSVEALVELVTAHFPGFRDEAVYRGEQVRELCCVFGCICVWRASVCRHWSHRLNSSTFISRQHKGLLL